MASRYRTRNSTRFPGSTSNGPAADASRGHGCRHPRLFSGFLQQQTSGLVSEDDSYTSLAGSLLERLGRMPAVDETVSHDRFEFRVVTVTRQAG